MKTICIIAVITCLAVPICISQSTSDSYRPSYIPLDRNKDYSVQFDKNAKVPNHMPPLYSTNGTYSEHFHYDVEQHEISARSKSDLSDEDEVLFNLPNVRRRRRQNEEQGRLLSQSAFNRITETLGALNKVGSFFLNMTREVNNEHGHQGDMQLISSSSSIDLSTSKPTTIQHAVDFSPDYSTTTKKNESDTSIKINKLEQNVTKTIEPLIKRIGQSQEKESKIDKLNDKIVVSSISEKIDMAALAEKKRKKHQAVGLRKDTLTAHTTVSTTLSPAQIDDIDGKEGENRCITPFGTPGRCEDLSICPSLLLNLSGLRDSLCFKRLFIPGVCCPIGDNDGDEEQQFTTKRPQSSLVLTPLGTTTTKRPPSILLPVQTISRPTSSPVSTIGNVNELNGNVVDENHCGQQEISSGRVVGGLEAESGEWPWLAAIFLHGDKRVEFWCGGSLIGSRFILTAAHCTRDSRQRPFAARQFTVRLGDIDLSTDREASAPVTFKVTEVRAHPRFSRVGFYNDIAIMVLDRPVRKSKYVIPICLPKANFPSKDRLAARRAVVVGWGTTYYGGKESTIQRKAELPIWRNEDCNRAYYQPITDNFVCAGFSEGGVDACQGDSGGPLMMRFESKWLQLGIVSFGNKCGEPGYPGVYTRVSEYIEWIQENTKDK
ncbi:proclotting enzyme [Sitodiplosis mosellana]|uniref:proclotting enzyme n=1 Tax=Sitodiplosis mosellana TaxID=263140 RepID=UPI0024437DEC|nr:proclotting enzyme [Sitodiplosis mosellana]